MDSLDIELNVLNAAGLDRCLGNHALQINDGFYSQGFQVANHFGRTFRILLVLEEARLNSVEGILAKDEETRPSLDADGMKTTTCPNGRTGPVFGVI